MCPDGEVTSTSASTKNAISDSWDEWVDTIVQERKSDSGSIRLLGFVRQLATEFVVNLTFGITFATSAYLVDTFSPFILMPNAWYAFPMYVGAAISLLFITSHDKWIRPKKASQRNSDDPED